MPGTMSLAMEACAVTNPFCPEAVGKRWPDNSMSKSTGWSITGFTTVLGTTAAGVGALMFVPNELGQLVTASGIAAPVITWNATSSPLVTMPSAVVRWRITSWGVRVRCISPIMTTSGTCRIRLFSPVGGSSLGTTSGTSIAADQLYDIPLKRLIEKDLFITPMPLGEIARLYQDQETGSTTIANTKFQWQVLQIYVDGAPASTSVLEASAYFNFEMVFADGDDKTFFAQKAPEENRLVQKTNSSLFSKIGNFVEGTVSSVDKVFQSKAVQYLASMGFGYATGGASGAAMGLLSNMKPQRRMIGNVD